MKSGFDLTALGWNSFFAAHFEPYRTENLYSGRVYLELKGIYRLYTEFGELQGDVAGRLRYQGREALPTVGDWVVIQPRLEEGRATIVQVLPRKSKFSRKNIERTEEQLVAANVDILFLVTALDGDFNIRRIERYLVLAGESGASPVIVLNKSDLCNDLDEKLAQVATVAQGTPVIAISARANNGLDRLYQFIEPGQTIALMGSSGVGKSSIINRLLGNERQKVNEVREHDDRGKHTTTYRELIMLPGGGMVIDTPGMRELQLWAGERGLQGAFEDIEELAPYCRFRDCRHENEPGCAVKEAIASGTLPQERFDSYVKLQKELALLEAKQQYKPSFIEKRRYKKMMNEAAKSKKHWAE